VCDDRAKKQGKGKDKDTGGYEYLRREGAGLFECGSHLRVICRHRFVESFERGHQFIRYCCQPADFVAQGD